MPAILDSCSQSLLKKWRENPSEKPKRFKKGDKMVPLKTAEDAKSASMAICTASLQKAGKLEHGDETYFFSEEVEFPNPVMTGWAMTNKPHITGQDPMSFVDENGDPWVEGESKGKMLLKVPLLILGKWRHRLGILDFTKKVIDKIEKNFHDGVAGHDISADAHHKDALGGLAWAVGKFVSEINSRGLSQWSVLAEPNSQGIQFVKDKVFKYGSIELRPNFTQRMMSAAALSADDIEGEWDEACIPCAASINLQEEYPQYFREDVTMSEENAVTLEQFQKVQAQLADLTKEREGYTSELARRDARIAALEARAVDQLVESIVLKAKTFKDGEGRAHSVPALEWLGKVLRLEPIGEDGSVITLEDTSDSSDVVGYFRRSVNWLFENVSTGGPVVTSAETQPDKKRPVQMRHGDSDQIELDEDDIAEIEASWDVIPANAEEVL